MRTLAASEWATRAHTHVQACHGLGLALSVAAAGPARRGFKACLLHDGSSHCKCLTMYVFAPFGLCRPIAKRTIIVCPVSLVSNWESECEKWLLVRASRAGLVARFACRTLRTGLPS